MTYNPVKAIQDTFKQHEIGVWDICSRMLGILFGRTLMFGFAPFGIAYLALERTLNVKSAITFIMVVIGAFTVWDKLFIMKYVLAAVMYMAILYGLSSVEFDKDKPLSAVWYGAFAGLGLFMSGFALLIWESAFTVVDAFLLFIECGIVVFSVYIFEKGKGIIYFSAYISEELTPEEKFSVGTLICVMILGLSGIGVGEAFNAGRLAAAALIMLTAVCGGAAFAVPAGVVLGFVCGTNSQDVLVLMAVFSFCGFVMGMVSGYGKYGVALSGIAACGLLYIYVYGAVSIQLTIYEVMTAALFISLVPDSIFEYLKQLLSKRPDKIEYSEKNIIKERLSRASELFIELSETYNKVFEKSMMNYNDVSIVFDIAAERVCRDCVRCSLCWEKEFNSTYRVMFNMLTVMEQKNSVDTLDVPLFFRERCVALKELINELNSLYEAYRVNCIWKSKNDENRELFGEQFRSISGLLNSMADEIDRPLTDSDNSAMYHLDYGAVTFGAKRNEACGDSHCLVDLGNGKKLFAISDGMGIGDKAAKESKIIIELLRRFLQSGFDKTSAVKMINSIIALKSDYDNYSTIDICIADLKTGELEFMKIGAAASYIKRKKKVETIHSVNLPVGALPNAEINTFYRKLEDNDIIIMMSDGVEGRCNRAGGNYDYIANYINGLSDSAPAQMIAEMIASLAFAGNNGEAPDDLMVVAVKALSKQGKNDIAV